MNYSCNTLNFSLLMTELSSNLRITVLVISIQELIVYRPARLFV